MADKRQFRAGSRNKNYRPDGRFSVNRLAWLKITVGQFILMRFDNKEQEQEDFDDLDEENGATVRLMIPRPRQRPVVFNITALTHDELKMMREFFTLIFDLAEPVVIDRDRIANEAYAKGDDSFVRLYRQVPQFIVRKGAVGPDGESIQERLEGVLGTPLLVQLGPGIDGDLDGGLRGDSDGVADDISENRSTQDD